MLTTITENKSDFLITNPITIYSKLSILLKHQNLVTVSYGGQGSGYVSTILAVTKSEFIVDACHEENIDKVINSSRIQFKTDHLGALISFEISKLKKIEYQGAPAFSAPLPSAIRWFEQREFYRMKVPISSLSYCEMPLQDGQTLKFKLHDISIRGLSVFNTDSSLAEFFEIGKVLGDCKLSIENREEFVLGIEIRNVFVMNPNNPNITEKIGCRFTQLSPSFEQAIHSYMLEIEREILKKRSGNTEGPRHY